jgi:hypothetical protein
MAEEELHSAQWILTAPHTWVYVSVARAFAARKLPMPPISLAAPSALLRVHLLATGPFVTAVPGSVLRMGAGRRSLKQLGADLNIAGYPLAILTLKNRSLSPLVALFIDHVPSIGENYYTLRCSTSLAQRGADYLTPYVRDSMRMSLHGISRTCTHVRVESECAARALLPWRTFMPPCRGRKELDER